MGLNQKNNFYYLNISMGKMVHKKGDVITEGVSYTGKLIGIKQEMDEYKGAPISKIRLTMRDEKEDHDAIISFGEETFYSVGFFGRILNINLDKPFTLGVMQSDKNEKVSFCWMKQFDQKIERHPDAVGPEKTVTPAKRGGPDITTYDYNKFLDYAAFITKQIETNIWSGTTEKNPVADSPTTETPVRSQQSNNNNSSPPPDDDLPF